MPHENQQNEKKQQANFHWESCMYYVHCRFASDKIIYPVFNARNGTIQKWYTTNNQQQTQQIQTERHRTENSIKVIAGSVLSKKANAILAFDSKVQTYTENQHQATSMIYIFLLTA